ncbi:polyheme membrane-associated cytochrome C [Halovulum sp. GXIMD14794]
MRFSFFSYPAILTAGVFAASGAFAQQNAESIVAEWAASAHAKADAEAFTHWNDEGEIPAECALCHAGSGFRDYYGLDGSPVGEMSGPHAIGGVIDCDTCHADGVAAISEVTFPSGVVLPAPENNATCFTCHQGRQSGTGIAGAVEGMELDTVNADLGFMNPHYLLAASTLHGAQANGAYQYDGKSYAGRFDHVEGVDSCTDCHSPHSLEVAQEECATCHKVDDPRSIRAGVTDWDGDGDSGEGLSGEIATLLEQLKPAIITYASETAGTPMVYSGSSYPYFFIDTDADGEVDDGEATFPNRYASWTPRLLMAAYNYQFAAKDPGNYAHNPHYVLQVLIDSIDDLTGEAPGTRP